MMGIRNFIFEKRQKKITTKINNKIIEFLYISRSTSMFVPITWEKVKPGYIIKIRRGEEFPADCLILDILGQSG
jgi:magnesium-transporting ATPase (P-type)